MVLNYLDTGACEAFDQSVLESCHSITLPPS